MTLLPKAPPSPHWPPPRSLAIPMSSWPFGSSPQPFQQLILLSSYNIDSCLFHPFHQGSFLATSYQAWIKFWNTCYFIASTLATQVTAAAGKCQVFLSAGYQIWDWTQCHTDSEVCCWPFLELSNLHTCASSLPSINLFHILSLPFF